MTDAQKPPADAVGSSDQLGAGGLTLKQKQAANVWDHIDDALAVIEAARAGRWTWIDNSECKYIQLRIDMRDGGCLIENRHGVRIDPARLAFQRSDHQHEPWPAQRIPLSDWQREQIAKAAGA
jgi:hypothetical protein